MNALLSTNFPVYLYNLFDNFKPLFDKETEWLPKIDISETEKEFIVKADMRKKIII